MQKITQKEYDRFIEPRLLSEGFSKLERDVIRSAFLSDLEDLTSSERNTFFYTAIPGIDGEELKKRMEDLRNPNSALARGLKVPLYKYPDKLEKLEKIMQEALDGNKEPWL